MKATKDHHDKKDNKTDDAPPEEVAPRLSEELETRLSDYTKSVEVTKTKLDSATEEAWATYRQSIKEISAKATQVWINSYAAYLDAYQKLPPQPDDAALEPVRSTWAAHVKACAYTPEMKQTWMAAQQALVEALEQINNSAAETFGAAAGTYSEGLRSALAAHGLTDLDPVAVQRVTYQIAAINAGSRAA